MIIDTTEHRPSVIVLILRLLAQQKARKMNVDSLIATLSPEGLPGDHALSVKKSLETAVAIGLVARSGDEIQAVNPSVKKESDLIPMIRTAVFDPAVNTDPWGQQGGARDLTSALAWFLTFSASEAPIKNEGDPRSAAVLQARDFGPREQGTWPIANNNRWNAFRYWACSLGFAWIDPKDRIIPDPTPVMRETISKTFGNEKTLTADEFLRRTAELIPVLDSGSYRCFIESNWKRQKSDRTQLTAPLSFAIHRLELEGVIEVADRHDAPRQAMNGGRLFSHVKRTS
jgi:hypothetical protein